jgi:tight adherence protein C
MTRSLVLAAILLWTGLALGFSTMRWFRRSPLADRLRPYLPGADRRPGSALTGRSGWGTSTVEVLGPLAGAAGARLARLFGVSEELGLRLRRLHSPLDPTAFRLRQLGWVVGAAATTVVIVAVARPPVAMVVLCFVGAPLLAFLVVEQQLARESASWQRRVFLELPVVSEQLGMLLSSGYSLGAALTRLARRGEGAVALDLRIVVGRVQQGLDDVAALREWSSVVRVPAVDRLVGVLALNREAADLGRLISEESRSLRDDVHRELIEAMERRGQQVWIPVTVATLLPGVLFLAVPFVEAMQLFTAG